MKSKYRAKDKRSGEYVIGNLIEGENLYISTEEDFYNAVVSPSGRMGTLVKLIASKTLGECIGIKDVNYDLIFENHLIEFEWLGGFANKEKEWIKLIGRFIWNKKELRFDVVVLQDSKGIKVPRGIQGEYNSKKYRNFKIIGDVDD